eukprot:2023854-Pyramimonas_sp.AAC.2
MKPAPRKTTAKQLRGAPSALGGLRLCKTRSCLKCRQPSPDGPVCSECIATETGTAFATEALQRLDRLQKMREEYAARCHECRLGAAKAGERSTEPSDIEEAVAGCENEACSTWLARHWVSRRLAREKN